MSLNHIKMTRAFDINKVIVDVDTVKNGKNCDCYCIVCNSPLIARQGKKNTWHFAHDFSNGEVDCHWSGETELHLLVKEYLSTVPSLLIPIGINSPVIESLQIDDVLVEMRYDPTRRIPDVTILSNGEKILVEIGVTHFCDQTKINEYKLMNINAIEFDFSDFFTETEVITNQDIERHFKDIKAKWLSIAPTGTLGQRVNNHERNYLYNLNKEIKEKSFNFQNNKVEHEEKIRMLNQKISSKKYQLNKIQSIIDDKRPEAEKIKAAEENFYKKTHELKIKMLELKERLVNQAKSDAETAFYTDITNFENNLERKYLEKNKKHLQEILHTIKLNEEKRNLSSIELTEIEKDLSNKLSELDAIKEEITKYLEIKDDVENSLTIIASKTKQIAQVRKQLNYILPEFQSYYRKTGTPCPFLLDVNKDLDIDVIQHLYNSLREKIDT